MHANTPVWGLCHVIYTWLKPYFNVLALIFYVCEGLCQIIARIEPTHRQPTKLWYRYFWQWRPQSLTHAVCATFNLSFLFGPFKMTWFKCPILNAYDCNCSARCKSLTDGNCEPVILWLACQRGSGLSCCCCWTHQIWELFGSFVTTSLQLFLSNSLGIGREITGKNFSLEWTRFRYVKDIQFLSGGNLC